MGNEDSIKEWKDMSIVRAEYSCVYDIDDKGIVNTNITFYNESGDKIKILMGIPM